MHESCPSFLDTHSTENCLVLPETQGLVQTSEKSSQAVKIWYKEPILTIPHFLVLQKGISSEESGFFQDYSLNTENSPIISYGNLLLDSRQTCGMYLENERKVIIKSLLSTFLYEWNFDDQGAIKLPVKTEDITERSFAGYVIFG